MASLRASGALAAAAAGAGCAALAVLVDAGVGPSAGEPLALRWMRAAADHPVRTAAAGACLFLALRPRAPRDPPASEETGAPHAW